MLKYYMVKRKITGLSQNEIVLGIENENSMMKVMKPNGSLHEAPAKELIDMNWPAVFKDKDGNSVTDRYVSHIRPETLLYLIELIKNIRLTEKFQIAGKIFEKHIGKTYCVPVFGNAEIYYKKRDGRKGFTKFVRNATPTPSKSLTAIFLKTDESEYIIITAFIGEKPEPEPWDEDAFRNDIRGYKTAKQASVLFWTQHALIE